MSIKFVDSLGYLFIPINLFFNLLNLLPYKVLLGNYSNMSYVKHCFALNHLRII